MNPALRASLAAALLAALAGEVLTLSVALVSHFEGRSLISYLDPVGIPTICDGYTHGVHIGDVATPEQCDRLTAEEVGKALKVVDDSTTSPLPDVTRAALASFVFNAGPNAYRSSNLLRRLNRGEGASACEELRRWVCVKTRAGTGSTSGPCLTKARDRKPLPGLVKRRDAESELCALGFSIKPNAG